jgi:hypothetical protein
MAWMTHIRNVLFAALPQSSVAARAGVYTQRRRDGMHLMRLVLKDLLGRDAGNRVSRRLYIRVQFSESRGHFDSQLLEQSGDRCLGLSQTRPGERGRGHSQAR